MADKEHVYLDAHVLGDIVVRDLNGDGRDEIVIIIFCDSVVVHTRTK